MGSYLEAYGAAEARHARVIGFVKYSAIALGLGLVVGVILFAIFRNHSEERQAENFLGLLQSHSYSAAYAMWGCTDSHPCPNYPFNKFMEDWGPKSEYGTHPATASIGLSQSCGSGVVIRLDYKQPQDMVALWVERDSGIISFAPYAECPGRHLHFKEWLRTIFHGS